MSVRQVNVVSPEVELLLTVDWQHRGNWTNNWQCKTIVITVIKKGWREIHYSLANNNKGELTNQVIPDKIHHISLWLWRWIKHRLLKVMNKSNEIPILAWTTLTRTIIFNLITFVWHDSWVQTIYCLRLSVM